MPSVLVVDDEPSVRRWICRCLRTNGFDVADAASGLEGLERYRSRRADLVVSDLVMKDMSGLSMLHEMRRLDDGLRAVVVTGSIEDSIETEHPLLHKPFACDELIAIVRAALREAA